MAYSQAAIIALLNLVWEQSFGVECQFSSGDACVVGSGNICLVGHYVIYLEKGLTLLQFEKAQAVSGNTRKGSD